MHLLLVAEKFSIMCENDKAGESHDVYQEWSVMCVWIYLNILFICTSWLEPKYADAIKAAEASKMPHIEGLG